MILDFNSAKVNICVTPKKPRLPSLLVAGMLTGLFVLSADAVAGSSSYQYDALGRITSSTESGAVVTTYSYDAAGNRTQVATTGSPYSSGTSGAGGGVIVLPLGGGYIVIPLPSH